MHSFESNSSNVPAFLVKLWKLVEDPTCNDLIAWNDNGVSFIINDQTRFSKDLLPQYFKHNNMASFIRQLNMYGFRKVMNIERSGLRNENDEMEFQHPFFCKGQSALLELIKRKMSNNKVTVAEPALKSNARDILTDLSSIREKQENMDNMLIKMKQENELLWRELTSMRQKHKAQEQIIQKVIQFLVTIVKQSNPNIGVKRKMARMLQDGTSNKENSQVIDVLRQNMSPGFITVPQDKLVSPLGPVIHEVTDLEHEQEENPISPAVKSPEDKTENGSDVGEIEEQEAECPASSLNNPIATAAAIEPLCILEPSQQSAPIFQAVLSPEVSNIGDAVFGIPYDCIISSDNVISISDDGTSNIISIPELTNSGTDLVDTVLSNSTDFYDSESLKTPQVPTVNIDDFVYPPIPVKDKQTQEVSNNTEVEDSNTADNKQNYQIAVTEKQSIVKSSALNNDEMRCSNYFSNSDVRFHPSHSNPQRRNTLSNHLLNVEEELNWLQDQISSNTWNIDANKLLGLFSTDDAANNEVLASEIPGQSNIKLETSDIIGNELVQFTPSMFEVTDPDLRDLPFLDCLDQEPIPANDDIRTNDYQENMLSSDIVNPEQLAASEAAEFLLKSEAPSKQKYKRLPKIAKLQRAKRRKLK